MTAEPEDSALPLDPLALSRLRELDPDGRQGVLMRVMAAFDTSLARMIVQLDAEVQGGNADVVAGIAHMLKSSSASVGALALSRVCAEVESKLRSGDASDLRHDIERLIAAAEAAQRSVAAILRA